MKNKDIYIANYTITITRVVEDGFTVILGMEPITHHELPRQYEIRVSEGPRTARERAEHTQQMYRRAMNRVGRAMHAGIHSVEMG